MTDRLNTANVIEEGVDENTPISNFSHQYYAETFSNFINNSDQVIKITELLEQYVFSIDRKYVNYIDVGAGTGGISHEIAKYVNNMTLNEPNEEHKYENIKQYKLMNNDRDFIFTHATQKYMSYGVGKKYEVILCSHVMYHIDRNDWKQMIMKMNSEINRENDGICVIIMVSDNGRFHDVLSYFNKDYSNSYYVKKILEDNNVKYDIVKYQTTFRTSDRMRFLSLIKLFVIDNCFSPDEYASFDDEHKKYIDDHINKYVDLSYDCDSNEYIYIENDDMILIK
jgi:2-polyprenyl-3-methyl-5-hydroxy-6-metoxy-1,4-benzoquinol methylase